MICRNRSLTRCIFALSLIVFLRPVIARDEAAARKLVLEAKAAYALKDFNKAADLAEQAIKADDVNHDAPLISGKANLEIGKYWFAYERLGTACIFFRDTPENPAVKALFEKAARLWIGKIDQMIGTMNPKEDQGDISDFTRQKARVYLALGEKNKALEVFTALIGNQKNESALRERAQIYESMGKDDLAAADYKLYISHASDPHETGTDYLDLLKKRKVDDQTMIAECTFLLQYGAGVGSEERAAAYENTKQFERAIADYRVLSQADPRREYYKDKLRTLEALPNLQLSSQADALFTEAKQADAAKNPWLACERSSTALALNPNLLEARVLIGHSLHLIPYKDQWALNELMDAREKAGPREAEVLPELHNVASDMAAKLAKEIEEDKPEADVLESYLRKLLNLQIQAGQLEGALATCGRIGKLDEIGGHITAGQVHELRRDYDHAILEYRAAVRDREIWDEATTDWRLLHDLRLSRKDYRGLVSDLSEALQKYPLDQVLRKWRAEARELAGDFKLAADDLTIAVDRESWNYKLLLKRYALLQKAGEYERMKQDCVTLIRNETPGYGAAATALAREAMKRGTLRELADSAKDAATPFGGSNGRLLFYAVASVLLDDYAHEKPSIDSAMKFSRSESAVEYALASWLARICSPLEAAAHMQAAVRMDRGAVDLLWFEHIAAMLAKSETLLLADSRQRVALLTDLSRAYPDSRPIADGLATALQKAEKTEAWHREWDPVFAKAKAEAANEKKIYEPALAAEKAGDFDAALKGYAQMIQAQPDHLPAGFRRGVLQLMRGDVEEARKTVLQTVDVAVTSKWEAKGQTGQFAGQFAGSIDATWAKNEMASQFTAEKLSRSQAIVRVARVFTATLVGDKIVPTLTQYMAEIPNDMDIVVARGDAILAQAWMTGKVGLAVADYRRAIKDRPNDATIHARLATALDMSMDSDGALTEWTRANQIDPENEKYCLERSRLLFRSDRAGQAIGLLSQFADAHRSVRALRVIANWHYENNRKDEALVDVTRILAIDPAQTTEPFPRDNYDMLVYFYRKTSEAVKQVAVDDAARRAAQLEARRKADELARRQAQEALSQRQQQKAQEKRDWVEELSEAVRNLPSPGDNGFSKMVDSNWRAGALLQKSMDAQQQSNIRMHEIERQFAPQK